MRWKILDAWQAAASQVGIAPIEEFNRGDNAGSAYFHVNPTTRPALVDGRFVPSSRRQTTTTVYTHACRSPDGRQGAGRPTSRCLDHRSASRHRRVRLLKDGQIVDVQARREVILSAGAIGSPQLMQASGLGPAGLLTQHQVVPVAVDLPG